jgi:Sulfotransferase domain
MVRAALGGRLVARLVTGQVTTLTGQRIPCANSPTLTSNQLCTVIQGPLHSCTNTPVTDLHTLPTMGTAQSLKVINTGLSRTGTLTLKVALERLGFGPCYHAFEYLGIPEHTGLWQEALDRNGRFSWERIFHGYQSSVDVPSVYFWRELVDAYPDALVILTERDPDQWYDSIVATIEGARSRQANLEGSDIPADKWPLIEKIMADMYPMEKLGDKKSFIQSYHRHNAAVRSAVPPRRLLSFRVTDGWRPLTKFLQVDLPDEPFPHVNAGDAVHANATAAAIRNTPTAHGLAWK